VTRQGRAFSLVGFTLRRGRILAIDMLAEPQRLGRHALSAFTG
jgi:hypothetical protein